MNTGEKITRWPYLVAGVVMLLLAGIIYAWSILKAPLAAEFGWDSAQLGLNFTITMCCFCVGGILGGVVTKKISPRLVQICAAILLLIGFFGSSRLTGGIAFLYIFYGGLSGLGIGVTYNVVISSVTKWFPDKRSTASGALMMGFGASTLILGSIMSKLIDASGWRTAYLILGVLIAVVLLIGSFFLKAPDERISALVVAGKKRISEVGKDHTTGEMLKTVSFWKVYILMILISAVGNCVISFARDVSISVGAAEALAVTLVGVLSVCNGLGRVVFGAIFDNFGWRVTMLSSNTLAIIACGIMLLSSYTGSLALVVVGLILVGFSFGSLPPISTGVASSFFGMKSFSVNFSTINTMLIPSSLMATLAGTMIGRTGSYVSVFIMLFVFAIVAMFINLSVKKP
jgi:OFA family oxalate/formate antiporter-like MFS transporter